MPSPVLGLLLLCASGLAAQESARTRWTDLLYQPAAWEAGRLAPLPTTNGATDTLALVAQAEIFSKPPRWRAELRKVLEGSTLEVPLVLVADRTTITVVTRLGSTPLEKHAAAADPQVRTLVKSFDGQGRVRTRGPARLVEKSADGRVQYVILRKAAAKSDFPDDLLATGKAARLGGTLARTALGDMGGAQQERVAATAGARGVIIVKTAEGELALTPDTAAVAALDGVAAKPVDLDEFLRQARLGPHQARIKR